MHRLGVQIAIGDDEVGVGVSVEVDQRPILLGFGWPGRPRCLCSCLGVEALTGGRAKVPALRAVVDVGGAVAHPVKTGHSCSTSSGMERNVKAAMASSRWRGTMLRKSFAKPLAKGETLVHRVTSWWLAGQRRGTHFARITAATLGLHAPRISDDTRLLRRRHSS